MIARDSVFSYKGKHTDVFEVGRDLGVQTVLAGMISHRDDEVVVSVELVDARDRRRLWGREYRRPGADLQGLHGGSRQADCRRPPAAAVTRRAQPVRPHRQP